MAAHSSQVSRSNHAIDALGWRPSPGVIEGPGLPGLAGVVQAQHNVAVDLQHFPSATNLRSLLVSQADVQASRPPGGFCRAIARRDLLG